MFDSIGWWEMLGLLLVAMFVFGPDRLPKAISDGVRMLRQLREMARNATGDLSRELGTDIQLEDLHPKAFVRKHLLSEEDEAVLRRPFDDLYREVRGGADSLDLKKLLDDDAPAPAPVASAVELSKGADRRRAFDDVT